MKAKQEIGTPGSHRYGKYASVKNRKRAKGQGGRQAASAGSPVAGFGYTGSGIMAAMLSRLAGRNR